MQLNPPHDPETAAGETPEAEAKRLLMWACRNLHGWTVGLDDRDVPRVRAMSAGITAALVSLELGEHGEAVRYLRKVTT